MAPAGIYTPAIPDPKLIALRYLQLRVRAHEGKLTHQFFRHPKVVGIEKRDEIAAGYRRADVARRRRTAPVRHSDESSRYRVRTAPVGNQARQHCSHIGVGAIRRTVIDNDQLQIRLTLRGDGGRRVAQHRAAVVNRNDDADLGSHGFKGLIGPIQLVT
jgi:hypothetical protein